MKKSRIVLVLCMMVVIAVASVAGTIAWLTDTTDAVQNTFTTSDIKISLEETWNADKNAEVEGNDAWTAQMIPGKTYTKDPVVTVEEEETDVEVYLFVKVTETNNPKTYLAYQYAWEVEGSGWTKLENGIYYRVVAADADVKKWNLIVDNQVKVRENLVKAGTASSADVVVMPADNATPTITFTAYAIQTAATGTAEEAWAKISN